MARLTPSSSGFGPNPNIILPREERPVYEDLEFQGGALGLNEGGLFVEPSGQQWYIKNPRSEGQTYSELLAGALYRQTGLRAPMTTEIETPRGPGIASRWEDDLQERSAYGIWDDHEGADWPGTVEGFPVDAWLANHDIVTPDNLVQHPSGDAFRVDPGGSLYYRAQGEMKPISQYPNPDVPQIDSLRDPRYTFASETFSGVSDATLRRDTPAMLGPVTPEIITDLAHQIVPPEHDPQRYARHLIERRAELMRRYGGSDFDPEKEMAASRTVFSALGPAKPSAAGTLDMFGGKPEKKPRMTGEQQTVLGDDWATNEQLGFQMGAGRAKREPLFDVEKERKKQRRRDAMAQGQMDMFSLGEPPGPDDGMSDMEEEREVEDSPEVEKPQEPTRQGDITFDPTGRGRTTITISVIDRPGIHTYDPVETWYDVKYTQGGRDTGLGLIPFDTPMDQVKRQAVERYRETAQIMADAERVPQPSLADNPEGLFPPSLEDFR